MSELASKKCVPCEGGVQPLSRPDAQNLMKQLKPEWRLADDTKSIASEWKFRNFFHTMSFVNAVAHVANAEDHHPDLEVGYGSCRIRVEVVTRIRTSPPPSVHRRITTRSPGRLSVSTAHIHRRGRHVGVNSLLRSGSSLASRGDGSRPSSRRSSVRNIPYWRIASETLPSAR